MIFQFCRACLVASVKSSGASQSTIKLVATNLIASGRLNGMPPALLKVLYMYIIWCYSRSIYVISDEALNKTFYLLECWVSENTPSLIEWKQDKYHLNLSYHHWWLRLLTIWWLLGHSYYLLPIVDISWLNAEVC